MKQTLDRSADETEHTQAANRLLVPGHLESVHSEKSMFDEDVDSILQAYGSPTTLSRV